MTQFASVDDILALLAKKVSLPPSGGANGQILVKDSSSSTGWSFADPAASGGGLTPLFPDSQTYGSSTMIPRLTRDSFGRITGVTEVQITYPSTGSGGGLGNPMTSTGDLIVGGSGGAATRLPGVNLAAKRFLVSAGTGAAATPPVWGQIQVADVVGAADLQTGYVAVNQQGGTTYTASASDVGKLVAMTSASANTFVLPLQTAAAIAVGKWIDIMWYGAGATSFGFTPGVSVRSPGGLLTIERQYRIVRAIKIGTNEWVLSGHFASTTSGGGSTGDTGTTAPVTTTNLLSTTAAQNASDTTKYTTTGGSVALDTAVAKSGGSSLKFTPDGSGTYGYVLSALSSSAPVTAGQTYTGFASVRMDNAVAAAFQVYIGWYNSSGTQLGISNADGPVTGVQNNFLQVASTGQVAPSGATQAIVIVEYGGTGDVMIAANTIHVDEFGINAGTSKTWTSGSTTPGTTTPASITDTGFTYSGSGWQAVTTPVSEHYSAVVGDVASATFTLTAPGTFALKGKLDSSNGTVSISVDNGSAVTVSESGTTTDNATIWTSGTLTAGTHTVRVTVASPEGSIQGATISNGTFATPGANTGTGGGTNTGGTGTGTSGTNTTLNGNIIGGPASASNPSGYAPPTKDAYPGYTNILQQDFATNFAEGRANGIAALPSGSGWFSYEGQVNGNYDGMNWDADQISATGSVVTMRNTNAGSNCQALAVMYEDAPNLGKIHKQQAMSYGKTMIRMKARGSTGYKIAFLMWPTTDVWNDGEIDFPEGDTVSPNPSTNPYTMTSNSHNVTGNPVAGQYQDAAKVPGLGKKGVIDDGNWHTFTLFWDPTKIVFYMDGVVLDTVTDTSCIPKVPMRWVLQCEPTKGEEKNAANYIDIDWVAAWKRG